MADAFKNNAAYPPAAFFFLYQIKSKLMYNGKKKFKIVGLAFYSGLGPKLCENPLLCARMEHSNAFDLKHKTNSREPVEMKNYFLLFIGFFIRELSATIRSNLERTKISDVISEIHVRVSLFEVFKHDFGTFFF